MYAYPDEATLIAGAGHLSYELSQFYHQWVMLLALDGHLSADSTAGSGIADLDHFVRSDLLIATLEAWLTHVRTILMAFRCEQGHGPKGADDVLFRDYLAAEDWLALQEQLRPGAAGEKRIDEIGTLLSHLSYRRADGRFQPPQWLPWGSQDFDTVNGRLKLWKAALPANRQYFAEVGRLIDRPPTALDF